MHSRLGSFSRISAGSLIVSEAKFGSAALAEGSIGGTVFGRDEISGDAAVSTNVVTADSVTATGTVDGGSLSTTGAVSADSVSATNDVFGGSLSTTGAVSADSVSATGTVTGGSLSTTGAVSADSVSATGTVTGGSLSTTGAVNAGSILTNTLQVTSPNYNFLECGSTGPQSFATQAVSSILNWAVVNQLGTAIVKADVVDPNDNAYDFIVLEDGIYSVECTISIAAGGGQRGVIIYLKGANRGHELDNGTGFENTRIHVSAREFMTAGERVRIAGFQNSGGNLDFLSGGLNRLTIYKEQ
jgi:hypothetical protein